MEESATPQQVPLLLPHPDTRITPDAADAALRMGLSPIIVENDKMIPIFRPEFMLARFLDGFRYQLRSTLAGKDWNQLCADERQWLERQKTSTSEGRRLSHVDRVHLENAKAAVFMHGYRALCYERDARDILEAMERDFRAAARSASELSRVMHGDQRRMNDRPLPIAREEHAAEYRLFTESMGAAYQHRTPDAAAVLADIYLSMLAWLVAKGALVLEAPDRRYKFNVELLTLTDIETMASVLNVSADRTQFILKHGINGVIDAHTKQNAAHPRDVLKVWLVQQGREVGWGPAKLADLLNEHKIEGTPSLRQELIRSLKNAEQDWNFQFGKTPVLLTV